MTYELAFRDNPHQTSAYFRPVIFFAVHSVSIHTTVLQRILHCRWPPIIKFPYKVIRTDLVIGDSQLKKFKYMSTSTSTIIRGAHPAQIAGVHKESGNFRENKKHVQFFFLCMNSPGRAEKQGCMCPLGTPQKGALDYNTITVVFLLFIIANPPASHVKLILLIVNNRQNKYYNCL